MAPFYRWGSTAFRLQSHYLLIANSEKYTLADCVLSINDYSNRGQVSTSINFNFHAWYEFEIRFSDDPRQKETIDGIIWLRRKKCNLLIRYYFQILFLSHVAQLIVSKMNFFSQRVIRRYPQRDIRRGIPNFITCLEVEK